MSWLSHDEDEEDLDESDIRIRPNRHGSRPRTKRRPEHRGAERGWVLAVYRGRYTVLLGENTKNEHQVNAIRAREFRDTAIVTGDRVDLVGDLSGRLDSLARIVRITERESVLRRSADDSDRLERVIVANASQLLIVVAAAEPEPRPRLIDRYLVAAFDSGIRPLIIITKTDLADPAPLIANVAPLEIPVLLSAKQNWPLTELLTLLSGHTTVVVGHSGVGKSTLVNALLPGSERSTGMVNAVTGRGRHTSSSTIALRLPTQGWVIDTPGIRSFGLGHVNPENVLRGFPDLVEAGEDCPRGCTHLPDSTDCAIEEAVQLGQLSLERYDSLQRLISSLSR